MMQRKLTLKDAIKSENLQAFVAQAEADGMPSADAERMYATLEASIKQPPEAYQTSPAPSRGGSDGK